MDTKQQIVERSYRLFARSGFHACGVEWLAQNAGTTKRTLYSHFGSKDGLIAAALDYRHQDFIGQLQAALEARPPAETAAAYLDFLNGWIRSPEFAGCLFINACAEYAASADAPHRQAAAHKQAVRTLLRERFQTAGFPRAAEMAELLYLGGEGLIVSAQTQGVADTETHSRLLAQAVATLAEAV
ncbi:TetR/AcrR family transcriptional regulator [Neisseria chenwenguii]|uniref:TetR family transcriptional regulator n=1 Tax=Neisseria chenwenguii TaxID=1853278 RepID=A0A220S3M0_9NEIS|nr:TetR/AcrR family transcriptional regulator [Neisseria chenwenguii]ASK27998.1 TetR family transcriptional regulator [Neisseria chenwenguii]ROV54467.1 TetR/AcrR family transcriptional regulator [Neisseria chenwenguii]